MKQNLTEYGQIKVHKKVLLQIAEAAASSVKGVRAVAHLVSIIDYKKCKPEECGNGICAAAAACPNKVLRQEAHYEYPFSHPSRFCRGCATCVRACPFEAIRVV